MTTKTKQMLTRGGSNADNQFIIYNDKSITFQSYSTIIARYDITRQRLTLDHYTHDMSRTTARYLNLFINDSLRWHSGADELRNARSVKKYNQTTKTRKLN